MASASRLVSEGPIRAVIFGEYDVFISHAGESRPCARYIEKALGGPKGRSGLGLQAFVDDTALRPGDHADEAMQSAINSAPVGLLLLDKHFLRKASPFKELRNIMALDRALPVLHDTTYDELDELLKELILAADSQPDDPSQHRDREMLQTLRRVTMLQTTDDLDLNRQLIALEVLRRLTDFCGHHEHEQDINLHLLMFRLERALKSLRTSDCFRDLSRDALEDADELHASISVQIRSMRQAAREAAQLQAQQVAQASQASNVQAKSGMLTVDSGMNSSDTDVALKSLLFVLSINKLLQCHVHHVTAGSIRVELQNVQAGDLAIAELLTLVEAVLGDSYRRAYLQLGTQQLFEVMPGSQKLRKLPVPVPLPKLEPLATFRHIVMIAIVADEEEVQEAKDAIATQTVQRAQWVQAYAYDGEGRLKDQRFTIRAVNMSSSILVEFDVCLVLQAGGFIARLQRSAFGSESYLDVMSGVFRMARCDPHQGELRPSAATASTVSGDDSLQRAGQGLVEQPVNVGTLDTAEVTRTGASEHVDTQASAGLTGEGQSRPSVSEASGSAMINKKPLQRAGHARASMERRISSLTGTEARSGAAEHATQASAGPAGVVRRLLTRLFGRRKKADDNTPYHVYLCYAGRDTDFADDLRYELVNVLKLDVYCDQMELPASLQASSLHDAIEERIAMADVCLFLVSRAFLESTTRLRLMLRLLRGRDREKKVLPLLYKLDLRDVDVFLWSQLEPQVYGDLLLRIEIGHWQTWRYTKMLSDLNPVQARQLICYRVLHYLSTVVYPEMTASLADTRRQRKHLTLKATALCSRITRVRDAFDHIFGQETYVDFLPEKEAAAKRMQRELDGILQAIKMQL